MERAPLQPINGPPVAQSKSMKLSGMMKVTPDQECLLKAVFSNKAVMQELGAQDGVRLGAAAAGALALRALGHTHDGYGNHVYDPSNGVISAKFLKMQEELASERLARQQLQAQVEQLQAEQLRARREAAFVADELRRVEADAANAAQRLAAAKRIAEKWRGRGRRAKAMSAHLKDTLPLTDEWAREFRKMVGRDVPAEQEGLRELWECQLRCLRSKSHRCRWHPRVLEWCLDVWRRDSGAYDQLALGGVLKLPSGEHLRKLSLTGVPTPGHDIERYKSLVGETKGWKPEEREFFLKLDEIHTSCGIAFRKVSFKSSVLNPKFPHSCF